MAAKKISESDIIGEQGIALVHQIVSLMGFLWYRTGSVEAGIDGFIEIRQTTGEVTNCTLKVQSRATAREFTAETPERFEYLCEEKDLDYWLAGNTPFLLVISRPSTNEAYWVSVKDYFRDPELRKRRRIVFDKKRDRFDESCRSALIALAVPKDSGLYLSPLPRKEQLYSNLLEVTSFSGRIFCASTQYRLPGAVWAKLRQSGLPVSGEWVLKSKQIFSFHDLTQPPWNSVCDASTVQPAETQEWSLTTDADRARDFVRLLNRCLDEKLRPLGIRYSKSRGCYYFEATPKLTPREISYHSLSEDTSREVFKIYYSRNDPQKVSYYRHSAFEGQFSPYGGTWFLEITPTYVFTRDGWRLSRFSDDLLKGIKKLERNAAVLGQLLMWADVLAKPSDLLAPAYPFMGFGKLHTDEIERGIEETAWLSSEEDAHTKAEHRLPLFE